jgi:hypothetical protein
VINQIIIKNNVLIGSNVLITDHSHGGIAGPSLELPPSKRPLVAKGPVIIEENVWIGGGCIRVSGSDNWQEFNYWSKLCRDKKHSPKCCCGGESGDNFKADGLKAAPTTYNDFSSCSYFQELAIIVHS